MSNKKKTFTCLIFCGLLIFLTNCGGHVISVPPAPPLPVKVTIEPVGAVLGCGAAPQVFSAEVSNDPVSGGGVTWTFGGGCDEVSVQGPSSILIGKCSLCNGTWTSLRACSKTDPTKCAYANIYL